MVPQITWERKEGTHNRTILEVRVTDSGKKS